VADGSPIEWRNCLEIGGGGAQASVLHGSMVEIQYYLSKFSCLASSVHAIQMIIARNQHLKHTDAGTI
jgi:hypothetical protein